MTPTRKTSPCIEPTCSPAALRCARPSSAKPNVSAIATAATAQPDQRREERVGQAGDELVAQVDRPGLAEHVELQADQRERAGQRDDERRDAEARDHEPVEQSDEGAEPQRGEHREHRSDVALHDQHRHHRGAEPAHRADRQVDLAQQQEEHDADRDGRHGRLLQHQVGEVAGAQEPVVLELEEGPDRPDHQQHEKRAGLAVRELAAYLSEPCARAARRRAVVSLSALMRSPWGGSPRGRTRPR